MSSAKKGLNQEIHISFDKINFSKIKVTDFALVLVMLVVVGYSLFVGWQAMQGEETSSTSQVSSGSKNSGSNLSSSGDSSSNALKLNLNYQPKREGAEINPDALELGKTNPFQ